MEGFTMRVIYFPSVQVYILTNNTIDRHKNSTFNHGDKCRTLSIRELPWLIYQRWLHSRLNLCGTYFSNIDHGLGGCNVLTVYYSTSDNRVD